MLVKLGTTVGAGVTVSAKSAVAGPPVPFAVSLMLVEVAVVAIVPAITPVDELRLKPEGRVEVLYSGAVTPEDLIVYEKGYPAWAVAVVSLVMPTPEEGAVSATKISLKEKSYP